MFPADSRRNAACRVFSTQKGDFMPELKCVVPGCLARVTLQSCEVHQKFPLTEKPSPGEKLREWNFCDEHGKSADQFIKTCEPSSIYVEPI